MAVCPTDCFYKTEEGVVLHDKDMCIGCGYCFFACPFGAPQFPNGPSAFAARGKMDKCTFCAGGPEENGSKAEFGKSTGAIVSRRASCRSAPKCARPRRLLAGDAAVISDIYRERVMHRGKGGDAWGWATAYGKQEQTRERTQEREQKREGAK